MIGANWAVTSASRHGKRLTHCNGVSFFMSPMSPIKTPETLKNATRGIHLSPVGAI